MIVPVDVKVHVQADAAVLVTILVKLLVLAHVIIIVHLFVPLVHLMELQLKLYKIMITQEKFKPLLLNQVNIN